MYNLPFNKPPYVESAISYIRQAAENKKICGDGQYTKMCSQWISTKFNAKAVLLTTSGSHALDMAAHLCGISPGDEVIMPSFTFSSTANAFVGAGATIVFVDIRPDTMNMDESLILGAITPKTKAIVPVHYAGVACEMDTINAIAADYNLQVVEDAAQGIMSTYKGHALGTLSDFGCFSFHETKNYSMGEGGALLIKDGLAMKKAEIMREKGTNRSEYFRGSVDKYTWVDWGSSYLPSELNAAYLWSQLEIADGINQYRLEAWKKYYHLLSPLKDKGLLDLPFIPDNCTHNAHMFYVKMKDLAERTALIEFLKTKGIYAVFHYVPLHSSPAGLKFGRFHGKDRYTTQESDRLVRLPMFYGLSSRDIELVVGAINAFFNE